MQHQSCTVVSDPQAIYKYFSIFYVISFQSHSKTLSAFNKFPEISTSHIAILEAYTHTAPFPQFVNIKRLTR